MAIELAETETGLTKSLLDHALQLAVSDTVEPSHQYPRTRRRTLTRRGILWLGQTCNLRCRFCYFLDRIESPQHPQHAFMTLDKVKRICDVMVQTYGNTSVDIQGGEPTLFPGILSLVAHCRAIGLAPTVITNGLRLAEPGLAEHYRDAGLRDFIISIHGLGPVYDDLVQRPGAHELQMRALANLRTAGVPFRVNCVLTRSVLPQLWAVAELSARAGAFVVNFLALNPFDDQSTERRQESDLTPPFDEISAPLNTALDILVSAGVEANVRYLPLCVVAPRHRQRAYTFHQLPYDLHENDFASWYWSGMNAQRTREGELSPPPEFGVRVKLGPLRRPLRALSETLRMRAFFIEFEARINGALTQLTGVKRRTTKEALYLNESRQRAREFIGYRHVDACARCDLRAICDGVPETVFQRHGDRGLEPVRVGRSVSDPTHFITEQDKVIHPEDQIWIGERDLP